MTGVAIRPRPQAVVIRRGTYCGEHRVGRALPLEKRADGWPQTVALEAGAFCAGSRRGRSGRSRWTWRVRGEDSAAHLGAGHRGKTVRKADSTASFCADAAVVDLLDLLVGLEICSFNRRSILSGLRLKYLDRRLEAVISQRTCVHEFYLQLKRLLVITRGSKLTSLEHFWELTSVEN